MAKSLADYSGYTGGPASSWAEAYNAGIAKLTWGTPEYYAFVKQHAADEAASKAKPAAPAPTPTGGGGAPAAPPVTAGGGMGGGGASGGPIEGLQAASPGGGGTFDVPPLINLGTPSAANPALGQRNIPVSGLVLSRRMY